MSIMTILSNAIIGTLTLKFVLSFNVEDIITLAVSSENCFNQISLTNDLFLDSIQENKFVTGYAKPVIILHVKKFSIKHF